jgi:hypothetical protein
MTNRPTALTVDTVAIPDALKVMPRWVLWRYTKIKKPNGEFVWSKVPFTTNNGHASSTNPVTWCSFNEAADALLMGDYDGLGIVLGGDLHGIDLDDCRDPKTGELNEFAQEVINRIQGYAEVSPSGTGLKIFCNTNLDGSRTKKDVGVELYRDRRYFTVTGRVLTGHEQWTADIQDLSWLVQKVWFEDLGAAPDVDDDGRGFELYKPMLDGWDLDRVVDEVLVHLDPDDGYGDWLKVGAALHHQSGGDPEWLCAWDLWSAGSSKWIENECGEKWGSFSQQRATGRGAFTLASLLYVTKDKREAAQLEKRDEAMQLVIKMIDKCSNVRNLQEKIADQIAHTSEFSDVEREQIANAIKLKAKDLGIKLSPATVRGWVRSRVKGSNSFLFCNEQGHPLCTMENMRTLLTRLGYIIRYNVIKKSIEILVPNGSFTRDNRDNAAIACVLSECEKVRMPTKHVLQFTIALADLNQFNPVMVWIESREWDGISRLEEFNATVVSKSPLKELLIRKWLIQAVAAAASPDGIASQGILTLVGNQNIGKTTWFQRLAPPELDVIFTGLILDLRSKDSIFIALTYWIVELGELDATMRKTEISALKSFTTQPVDKLRRPYAAKESVFGRRTVFGATVNDDKFLQDPTGNRRFYSLPVEGFAQNHAVDMQQLWAEILFLWRSGEPFSLTHEESARLNESNRYFTIEDPIKERLTSYFEEIQSGEGWHWWWATATQTLEILGFHKPTSHEVSKAGKFIRNLNGEMQRDSNGKSLLAVPLRNGDDLDL